MIKKQYDEIKNDLQFSEDKKLHFNNYSDFCNYLNIDIKTSSKEKNKQLQRLKSELDFEQIESKQGNKILHTYIINDIIHPIMNLNKTKLDELTQYTILSFLLYQHRGQDNCVISMNHFAKMIGYITAQYSYYYSYRKQLSARSSIPIYNIDEFFDKTNELYHRYINNAINSLENYKFISVNTVWYGCFVDVADMYYEDSYTEFGDIEENLNANFYSNHRQLNKEERNKVIDLEIESFLEVTGMKELPESLQEDYLQSISYLDSKMKNILHKKGLMYKYQKILKEKLIKELNISIVYKAYDIVYNYNRLYNMCKEISERLDLQDINNSIYDHDNNKFIFSVFDNYLSTSNQLTNISTKKLIENTKTRHEKEKQKIDLLNIDEKDKKKYKNLINRETIEFIQLSDNLLNSNPELKEDFLKEKNKEEKKIIEKIMKKETNENLEAVKKVNDNWNKHHKRPDKRIKISIE